MVYLQYLLAPPLLAALDAGSPALILLLAILASTLALVSCFGGSRDRSSAKTSGSTVSVNTPTPPGGIPTLPTPPTPQLMQQQQLQLQPDQQQQQQPLAAIPPPPGPGAPYVPSTYCVSVPAAAAATAASAGNPSPNKVSPPDSNAGRSLKFSLAPEMVAVDSYGMDVCGTGGGVGGGGERGGGASASTRVSSKPSRAYSYKQAAAPPLQPLSSDPLDRSYAAPVRRVSKRAPEIKKGKTADPANASYRTFSDRGIDDFDENPFGPAPTADAKKKSTKKSVRAKADNSKKGSSAASAAGKDA